VEESKSGVDAIEGEEAVADGEERLKENDLLPEEEKEEYERRQ
jgi:hypothetical protein